MLQMFAQKGKTQYSELVDYYKDIDKPLDISMVGFYKARMNFNPEAIRYMSNVLYIDIIKITEKV